MSALRKNDRDLRHLLDLLAMLPSIDGQQKQTWQDFLQAIGHSSWDCHQLSVSLQRLTHSLIGHLENAEAVEAWRVGAELAKFVLLIFGRDETEILHPLLRAGTGTSGRQWEEDTRQTAWRICLADPQAAQLVDARPINEMLRQGQPDRDSARQETDK